MSGEIVTERLALRPLTGDEASAVVAGTREGRIWAHDYPTEGDIVVSRLLLLAPDLPPTDFGTYQVVRRDTGIVVGGVGFKGSPRDGAVEVGYGLAPSARGAGLATEAVLGLVTFARSRPEIAVVEADTEPGNEASQRVLVRAGFELAGTRDGRPLFQLTLADKGVDNGAMEQR
ncbi:MAG: GNAT family N-acetyltransferase [Actinomycetes bacterium]